MPEDPFRKTFPTQEEIDKEMSVEEPMGEKGIVNTKTDLEKHRKSVVLDHSYGSIYLEHLSGRVRAMVERIFRDEFLDTTVSGIATAIADAANAQATADGKIVTFYADDPPTAEGTGDLWLDTNDGNRLYRWSGAAWIEVQDDDIAQAIADAATAQTTADGKIVTFYQDSIPTATDIGDLWVDTNDKNKLYRAAIIGADEITPGEWEVARDTDVAQAIADAATAQATADGKIVTFYQDGIPTSTDIGDLWIDTNDGNKLYRAESIGADQIIAGEWIEIQDDDIAQAIADAGTAQATADGKIVTFFQDAPPTADGVGDIWIDTNDDNKPYRWSGAAWVSIRDVVVLTFDRIHTTVLQAQFSDVGATLTIGYEGTGTIASPNEGDRRIYIDGDEISFVEYTDGAWSTVNQIRLGGVNSSSLFYPFLQCRGVLNPLADEVNTEFFPSADFRVFNFENNYEDQHGVDDWSTKVDVALTTAQKKFGLRSLFATANNDGSLATPSTYWSVGEDQAFGIWFYPTVYSPTLGFSPIFCYRTVTDTLEIIVFDDKVRMLIQKGGNTTTNDFTIALPLNTWHFVGLIYDSSLDKIYLVVNDEIVSRTTFPGTWNTGTKGALVVVSGNNYNGSTYYLDEAVFAPDQLIDPDIFVQHYNHDVAWNTNVSAKDVLLKPADGGRIVIDDAPDPSGGTWHKIANPSTGWKASKTSWSPADSFSAGLEVTFSEAPAGAKAVRCCILESANGVQVYSRKSGDTNISNTPHASSELSHEIFQAPGNWTALVCEIWLSSDRKAQFTVNTTVSLYIAYPMEYLI